MNNTGKKDSIYDMVREIKLANQDGERLSVDYLMKRHDGKRRRRVSRMTTAILSILAVGLIGFSLVKLGGIYLGYQKGTSTYNALTEQFVATVDPEENAGTATPEHDNPGTGSQETAVGCPITVDFEALQEMNSEVVGWICIPDTVINYPLMQTTNNDKYLTHMSNGEYNAGGSIFLDCNAAADLTDSNTIIYGHYMKDHSMFGSLLEYKKQDYFNEHPYFWILTPDSTYLVRIVAGSVVEDVNAVYYGTKDADRVDSAIDRIENSSTFDTSQIRAVVDELVEKLDATAGSEVKYVTLSTCSYEYEDARYVLVGELLEVR